MRSPVAPDGALADTAVFPWRDGPEAEGTVDDEPARTTVVAIRPRSADMGLLAVRIVLGLTAVLDGARTLFSVPRGHSGGTEAVRALLAGYGFRPVVELTTALGWAELVAGVLVGLGVAASFAASALLAVATVAVGVTLPAAWAAGAVGPARGWLLTLVAAAVVVLAGPGRHSGDWGRPWERRQTPVGLTCLVIGVGTGLTVLLAFR